MHTICIMRVCIQCLIVAQFFHEEVQVFLRIYAGSYLKICACKNIYTDINYKLPRCIVGGSGPCRGFQKGGGGDFGFLYLVNVTFMTKWLRSGNFKKWSKIYSFQATKMVKKGSPPPPFVNLLLVTFYFTS